MPQAKFSLKDDQVEFLNRYESLGFEDKSELVRAALDRLKRDMDAQRLRESADLYAEMYATDPDLRRLTDQAGGEWPD